MLNYTLRWSIKNVFVIISSDEGKVIWKKSAGIFGFKCWGKRSPDAIKMLIASSWEYLGEISENVTLHLFIRFISVPQRMKNFVKKEFRKKMLLCPRFGILILGCQYIDKIAFGGCKNPNFSKL